MALQPVTYTDVPVSLHCYRYTDLRCIHSTVSHNEQAFTASSAPVRVGKVAATLCETERHHLVSVVVESRGSWFPLGASRATRKQALESDGTYGRACANPRRVFTFSPGDRSRKRKAERKFISRDTAETGEKRPVAETARTSYTIAIFVITFAWYHCHDWVMHWSVLG